MTSRRIAQRSRRETRLRILFPLGTGDGNLLHAPRPGHPPLTIDIALLRPRLTTALGAQLELGELLGVGGFSAVFRAHDPRLQRDVAIKVLDPALALTSDLEAQFLTEARIVAGVEHPYIVPLYAAESREGLLYLVMRLLPGQSLAERLEQSGMLPVEEAARLAHEVAQALAAAHAQGVVHRDIKPDNILLDAAGHGFVTDFGISLVTAGRSSGTPGTSVGTPRYISPEQALDEPVDGRADVYSLGIILFEMLTGAPPFSGRTVAELIAKQVAAPAPSVAALRPETPAPLVTLTARMLAKLPEDRPTSADLVTLLAAARTPEGLLSPAAVRRQRLRRRLTIAGVALGTAAIVLWGAVAVVRGIYRLFEGGAPPALDALGPAVPESLLRAARSEGSLHEGETVLFAFIPAGQTATDAMIITDTALIRRSTTGARRLVMEDADLQIARLQKPGWDAPRGFLIAKLPGGIRDTIYDQLSGAEVIRMMTDLRAYQVALDSTKQAREDLRSP